MRPGEKLPTIYKLIEQIAPLTYLCKYNNTVQEACCNIPKCVEYIEEDITVSVLLAPVPTDPYYDDLPVDMYDAQYYQELLGVREAWDYTHGENILIGIIDTGIDFTVSEVAHAVEFSYSATGESSAQDYHGHGTMVASCIAGKLNGDKSVGIAYGAKLAIAQANSEMTGSFQMSNIIKAIDWCISKNVQIINMSLGSMGVTPLSWQEAIDRATSKGILVFCASGNSAQISTQIGMPANAKGVISVGSHHRNNGRSIFSQYAPIGQSGKLKCYAPGEKIWVTSLNGVMKLVSGTSFSSPIAAACAALYMSYYGSLTYKDFINGVEYYGYPVRQYLESDQEPTKRVSIGNLLINLPKIRTAQRVYSRTQLLEIEYYMPHIAIPCEVYIYIVTPYGKYWLNSAGGFMPEMAPAFKLPEGIVTDKSGLLFGDQASLAIELYHYNSIYPGLSLKDQLPGKYTIGLEIKNTRGSNIFPKYEREFQLI